MMEHEHQFVLQGQRYGSTVHKCSECGIWGWRTVGSAGGIKVYVRDPYRDRSFKEVTAQESVKPRRPAEQFMREDESVELSRRWRDPRPFRDRR